MTQGICALCLKAKELRQSHIIPEFCYKPLYDDKHRAHLIHADTSPKNDPFIQKGLRFDLLCHDCEQHISKHFETPVAAFWNSQKTPIPDPVPEGVFFIQVPAPATFKLFHLANLWRAGAVNRAKPGGTDWKNVYLTDKHAERLRLMILNRDPGAITQYPIMASAITDPLKPGELIKDLITPPIQTQMYGMNTYSFVFSGCQWFYVCAGHYDHGISQFHLQEDGSMPLLRIPFTDLEHVMDVAAQAYARGDMKRRN